MLLFNLSLETIRKRISHFNTSNVTIQQPQLYDWEQDEQNFNTSNVTIQPPSAVIANLAIIFQYI